MSSETAPERHPRMTSLDGLRAVAIVLVVLHHGWTVYPYEELAVLAPFDSLFRAGDLGVTLFFVVSGFLVVGSMLESRETWGATRHWWVIPRRLARSFPQLVLLLAAILVLNVVDATDDNTRDATTTSAWRIATYTWNWYLLDNPLGARADLGHLWYLSVELHVLAALAVVVSLLGGGSRRRLLVALLAALLVVVWWRWHAWDVEGWYATGLRTTTRADGLLYGAVAAVVVPMVPASLRKQAPAVAGGAALLLVGVVIGAPALGLEQYYKGAGVLAGAVCALLVLSMWLVRGTGTERALSWPPLVALGGYSLTIYIWHYPLLWALSRHSAEWRNLSRVAVGIALVAVVTYVVHRYVDTPAARWAAGLRRHPDRSPTPLGADAQDEARPGVRRRTSGTHVRRKRDTSRSRE